MLWKIFQLYFVVWQRRQAKVALIETVRWQIRTKTFSSSTCLEAKRKKKLLKLGRQKHWKIFCLTCFVELLKGSYFTPLKIDVKIFMFKLSNFKLKYVHWKAFNFNRESNNSQIWVDLWYISWFLLKITGRYFAILFNKIRNEKKSSLNFQLLYCSHINWLFVLSANPCNFQVASRIIASVII